MNRLNKYSNSLNSNLKFLYSILISIQSCNFQSRRYKMLLFLYRDCILSEYHYCQCIIVAHFLLINT